MKKIELKTKENFENNQEWIKYALKNSVNLGKEEFIYIFKNLEKKPFNPKYNSLRLAIAFLLKTLDDEKLEEILTLLNTDFKFKHKYTFNIETLKREFNSYSYKCLKENTALYIVKLADTTKQKKSTLENTQVSQL